MTPKAVTFSLAGPDLTEAESRLFQDVNPFGFILFKRNCETPDRLKKLTDDLRDCLGRDCPILIDQEGGRVQRLKPPHWQSCEPMKHFGDTQDRDALQNAMTSIAQNLIDSGIGVNCAPVLDVLFDDTHDAIGDRAFSANPDIVGQLGALVCETLLNHDITPVIKHLPGQGRSALDSHHDLPVVEASLKESKEIDFKPFQYVIDQSYSDCVWGMTSHILYSAIDKNHPASISVDVIDTIRSVIGFDGLLLSDDLSMNALEKFGDIPARVHKVLEAGCDVALYCAGQLNDMEEIAKTVPDMRADSMDRYDRSRIRRRSAA